MQNGEKALKEKNLSLERFIKEKGFVEAFKKFLEPKSIKEYLREYKAKQAEKGVNDSKAVAKKYSVER